MSSAATTADGRERGGGAAMPLDADLAADMNHRTLPVRLLMARGRKPVT